MALLSAEEVLFQERTDAEELGSDDAEGDDHQSDGDGGCGVEDEVVTVHAEELTHHRQFRQEEIVEQIDVERATAYELQTMPYLDSLLKDHRFVCALNR